MHIEAAAAATIPSGPVHEPSLDAVNGWRGPGALAIALAHLGIATDYFVERHLEPIALVVDLFFVLSGMLIAKAYTEKLARPAAIPDYIVRRFGSIWPVQAFMLGILVVYELIKLAAQRWGGFTFSSVPFGANGLNLVQAIPTNLLLVHSLGVHDRETWNFPSWSLSVEFATYVVFALFCLLTPVVRRTLAAVTILASVAILVSVAPYHMRSTFDYGIFRCLAGFFAGTLCYDVARRWRLPDWPLPTLVEIGAIFLVGLWLELSVGTYAAFAAPVVFCLFILAFLPQRGLLSRLLRTKPLQFMAELSFTIYMVHALVLIFLLGALHSYEKLTGTPLFVTTANPLAGHPGASLTISVVHIPGPLLISMIAAVYVALVLTLSYLTYLFVERPGRTFFNGLAKRIGVPTPRPGTRKPARSGELGSTP